MLGCLILEGQMQNIPPTPHSYILIDKKNNIKLFLRYKQNIFAIEKVLKKS